MFIEFYKHKINDNDLKKLEKKFKNKWHEYKIEIEGNQVNIKTILDTYSIFKLKKSQEQYNHNMFYVNENTLTMLPKYNDDYANFLFYIFLSEKRNWYYDAENNNIHYIIISDQENDYYIKNWEGWKAIFLNSRTKRLLLPCSKKYKELALKTDHKIDKALEELKFFFRIPDVACFKSPQMISPYILLNPHEYGASAIDGKRLAEDINENLIKLVYDNRADSTVQKEDIICKYKEFISNVKLTLD